MTSLKNVERICRSMTSEQLRDCYKKQTALLIKEGQNGNRAKTEYISKCMKVIGKAIQLKECGYNN